MADNPLAMNVEIELKLALPAAAHRQLTRLPLLRQAGGRQDFRLHSIYYDTPDLTLRDAGIALRLRRDGDSCRQTVKCAGDRAGGLSVRREWEVDHAGQFDFSAVDDESVRRQLSKPKVRRCLLPAFETRVRRTVWQLGKVAVMFDRGWVVAGSRRLRISELELELAGGDCGDLFSVARELAAQLPLMPAARSKADRGYQLCTDTPDAPVRGVRIHLADDMSPKHACHTIASACLEQLHLNIEAGLGSDDPEYLHQMRVALRRLRAGLRLFGPALEAGSAGKLAVIARDLARLLGRARDLDVLIDEIVSPATRAMEASADVEALVGRLAGIRRQAREQVRVAMATPAVRVGLIDVAAGVAALATPHHAPDPRPSDQAPERLGRLRRKVRRSAANAADFDPVRLHRLRVAIKRLRYALEFLGEGDRGKTRRRTIGRLAAIQDTLGQINDLVNAGPLLVECMEGDAALLDTVARIGDWHLPRYGKLMARLPALLAELRRLPRLA